MDRTDLQRLSKDELIELVIQLQRPDKASLFRSGELTPVWVPDDAHEAVRDLSRARQAAVCATKLPRSNPGL